MEMHMKPYLEEHPLSDEPVTITYERDGLEYKAEVTTKGIPDTGCRIFRI